MYSAIRRLSYPLSHMAMATPIRNQLIVYDFDWSMIDQDSDRWIFEVLAPHLRRYMKNVKASHQWTDLVAESLRKLHAEGRTREDIEQALRIIPFHPAMIRGAKRLKERVDPSSAFLCLSNANTVFISTILETKGMSDFFADVVTNPAEWDESGLLKLRRRIDPAGPQHQCKIGCSPNMCKGEELEAFLKRHGKDFDRIVYVGDGSNDFCPVVRLRPQDLVLCRRFRGLETRIAKEGGSMGLKAPVKYWTGAWEAEELLKEL